MEDNNKREEGEGEGMKNKSIINTVGIIFIILIGVIIIITGIQLITYINAIHDLDECNFYFKYSLVGYNLYILTNDSSMMNTFQEKTHTCLEDYSNNRLYRFFGYVK